MDLADFTGISLLFILVADPAVGCEKLGGAQ